MTEDNSPRRIDAKINRGVERASELYEDNAALRAMVLSIPYLGGGLDVIFTVDGQRAAKERIHRLLEELRQRMEQLEEDAINTEFLGSDAFIDLVIKAFESDTRTRDEEKIRWYAHILAGSTLQQEQAAHLPEEYLHLASELTPKELRVALSAYESQSDLGEPWAEWGEKVCREYDIDKSDLPMVLSRLEARGLMGRIVTMGDSDDLEFPGGPKYKVSPSFERLMRFMGQ